MEPARIITQLETQPYFERPPKCQICGRAPFDRVQIGGFPQLRILRKYTDGIWRCQKCAPKTHMSLFSGIGGFDLAAQWAGWNNVAHCEINPFGRKVLNYYWPEAESLPDVTQTEKFRKYAGSIDIISGGFPCQPYSMAGKRRGKEDERHLWPSMLEIIRIVSPRWVVGENVRGIVSWNGGLVFEEVCVELENKGYEVQPFILPAASVGAPHKRERVWFIARLRRASSDPGGNGFCGNFKHAEGCDDKHPRIPCIKPYAFCGNAADADRKGLEGSEIKRSLGGGGTWGQQQFPRFVCPDWENFPTESPVCGGNDGFPAGMDGVSVSEWRKESIKGFGNAIVPQVAYNIFMAINQYEAL